MADNWLDDLRADHLGQELAEIDILRAENKRLREALVALMPPNVLGGDLSEYADDELFYDFYRVQDVRLARAALEDK